MNLSSSPYVPKYFCLKSNLLTFSITNTNDPNWDSLKSRVLLYFLSSSLKQRRKLLVLGHSLMRSGSSSSISSILVFTKFYSSFSMIRSKLSFSSNSLLSDPLENFWEMRCRETSDSLSILLTLSLLILLMDSSTSRKSRASQLGSLSRCNCLGYILIPFYNNSSRPAQLIHIFVLQFLLRIIDMAEGYIELTPQQYESVLKYMETTNEDDYTRAVEMMKAHQFVLQNAVSTKLGISEVDSHTHHGQQEDQAENEPRNQATLNARNLQEIKKYIQYVREKQSRSTFMGLFNYAKNFVVGLLSGITELLLPQFLLRKVMRSRFYNMYRSKILPEFRDRALSFHLRNSYLSRKPIMFVISGNTAHDCVVNLFTRPQIAKKINESFIFSGAIADEKECNVIEGEKQPPSIIICRKNAVEKIEVIKRFVGDRTIESIDVDQLNYALRDHQRATRKDRNMLVKYRNYIRRNYYGGRPGFYEEEEEEEELYFPEKHTVVSDMIKKQNEDYKKVEEETKRKESVILAQKIKKQQETRKHEELEEERKVRKMSIPEQPVDGQIIRFNFRCPDGSTKTRNFESHEKLDLIYHWVQTNEAIEFEDNIKRQFELLHGFPPASLSNRKEEKLRDIFESDQQKIMIRQL